ncbi:MAG: SRPBCC domain-containing protein [Armatimonadetes bacterium]|nr:SRPBCC domain-containing protein [Armatimonadota bacterium]
MERVWQALTDPSFLSRWLMPADFKPTVGYRYSFQTQAHKITGEVLECDGKSRLVYTWDDGESDEPSLVSWSLRPDGDGTRLTLEHSEFAAPEPYVLIEAHMNWSQASVALAAVLRMPVPIVYCADEPVIPVLERAGFRQPEKEEASCQA